MESVVFHVITDQLASVTSKLIKHIMVSSMWQHINTQSTPLCEQLSTTNQLLDVVYRGQKSPFDLFWICKVAKFCQAPHELLISKKKAYRFHANRLKSGCRAECQWYPSMVQSRDYFTLCPVCLRAQCWGPRFFLILITLHERLFSPSDADDALLGKDVGVWTLCTAENITALYDWPIQGRMS